MLAQACIHPGGGFVLALHTRQLSSGRKAGPKLDRCAGLHPTQLR